MVGPTPCLWQAPACAQKQKNKDVAFRQRGTFGGIAALTTAWDAKGAGFCRPSYVPVAAAPPQAKHARASIAPSAMARLRQVPLALSTFLQIESKRPPRYRHIDNTHRRHHSCSATRPPPPLPTTATRAMHPHPSFASLRRQPMDIRAPRFFFCTIPLPILGPRCLAGWIPPRYVSQSLSSSPARSLSPRGSSAPQPARAAARHSLPETDAYSERPRDTRSTSPEHSDDNGGARWAGDATGEKKKKQKNKRTRRLAPP